MSVVVCVLTGYLVGGIPAGLVVVRRLHPGLDLRGVGTGNVGTSNIFRNVGARPAIVVGPLQFVQGLFPILLARWAGLSPEAMGAVAVAAVIGNGWPIWAGFKGGRGIAVATGAVAGLGWVGLAALLACYAAGLLAGEIALGVLAGFLVLPIVELVAAGVADSATAVCLLGLVLLRRLEGVGGDLAQGGHRRAVVAARLLRDERPGRPLVGPRSGG